MKKFARRVGRRGGGLSPLYLLFCLLVSCMLSACNVTRTVTTSSQYFQKGDTSCVIQTKTIETYDGTIKR